MTANTLRNLARLSNLFEPHFDFVCHRYLVWHVHSPEKPLPDLYIRGGQRSASNLKLRAASVLRAALRRPTALLACVSERHDAISAASSRSRSASDSTSPLSGCSENRVIQRHPVSR
jgi:hypothetical protein